MDNKYYVRIMRSEIHNVKNVNYGEVAYMNYGSINSNGMIQKSDVVGIYGQNGSGKTALVEALDMFRYIIRGEAVPFDIYAGILPDDKETCLVTDCFIQKGEAKYKVTYTVFLRANAKKRKIEIYKEKLVYWRRGSTWKSERDIEFENPDYNNSDLLAQKAVTVQSQHANKLKNISFLWSMEKLALFCSQQYVSIFFNSLVHSTCSTWQDDPEQVAFKDVVIGLRQFGMVDLNIIKVNQLGTINNNQVIPINVRRETADTIEQECIQLYIADATEIPADDYPQVQSAIDAINIVLRSVVPNLQIELKIINVLEKPDETKAFQVNVYSNRGGKRFLVKYESEGIKRIISILHYLIAVFNNPGVSLVVDEMDSGIFEYLLGELLGLMHNEMKGQLIFTSHNLRVLEKLDAKNIICSTVNPDNRYIRLVGIEKNHNKRDFYIRTITVGGQKEELYDEDDLLSMGYAFRKAGKLESEKANKPILSGF